MSVKHLDDLGVNTHLPNPLLGSKVCTLVAQLIHLPIRSDEVLRHTITLDIHSCESLIQITVTLRNIVQIPQRKVLLFLQHLEAICAGEPVNKPATSNVNAAYLQ